MIQRLCIIGVGLIGGSLARALRDRGECAEVVGSSRRAEHLDRAVELGVIDRYELDMSRAVAGADMVLVATPMGAMANVFDAIKSTLAPGAVVTDAGSVKQTVLRAAEEGFGYQPSFLVPGHPIAGTEHSGVDASFSSLFEGRRVILTPTDATDPEAVRRVEEMWAKVGATVDQMAPAHHDEVLAATSHLPHLLAYTLVGMLGQMHEHREIFRYAAGGFRDFSRIASSDPRMWHDICLDNREAIVEVVEGYRSELAGLLAQLRNSDSDALFERFAKAKQTRDRHTGDQPIEAGEL